jgi:hypothetical protein
MYREYVFMGTWDCGPFDNDTAADFAGDLDGATESARVDMLYAALAAVDSSGSHVDATRAEVALAAAALVARNLTGGDEFQSPHYGPVKQIPPIPEILIPLAVDVIDCLLNGENDLKDNWSKSPEGAKWFSSHSACGPFLPVIIPALWSRSGENESERYRVRACH